MKKLLLLLLCTCMQAAFAQSGKIDWKADLEFLTKELPEKHCNFFTACRPQRAGASPPRRAAQRDTDRLSSRKSRSQAEVGPCKGPLQRLGRVNGIPVQTAGILCY
ncbi:hypothetical protein [Alistipes shahii]|uniref:hypothetical protein n=1 Tax=Alistipes shahii TaxID=328814 RepID=UPI003AB52792